MKRRVVVTGLGAVTPLGDEVDQLWNGVLEAQSGIKQLSIIDPSPFKVKLAGDIPDFDPGNYCDPKDLKRLDRFTLFALYAGGKAIEDSGLDFDQEDRYRCGVILGSGIGGLAEIEVQVERLLYKGPDRVSPLTIPKLMLNAAGGNLSIRYGLKGPNFTVATACASATNAMGDALKTIQYDDADVVITGGTEAAITAMGLSAFQNMKALSGRNDEPHRASRPFDTQRDGFVLSEGAGILVFEELEHAKARGAKIYGEVLGYGASGDAGHITQPDPQGAGASRAMQNALRDAKLDPTAMDYINAHGTSTPLGDKAETQAMKAVYGDHAYKLAVSSTKGSMGHSLGASGGIEMIVTMLAIQNDVVPPTANLENPDPACDLDYTPLKPASRTIHTAMNNSFGFGGHNASIVCGKVR
ncbi:beta-ketoacyl-ACP synthase II [Aureliella helgolandensis]|uniref:3-oxoacyl-[acyl-carrier-protein] synthase 2 n=1 Tax=Aureliella helgolandensis TaxID=2527968 RepID=A0A518GG46_9BACT|nr:beta-ketoacyl-ACP synthase II [Aureliella helgolandensis]QDV27527.1 3-oxoacyl-[acyl-carrier-protein] synthase 2 [Aureliella helgolandensis]